MNNIKIFRANRGEGKTKWLVERAKECAEAGYNLYYIGWMPSYKKVKMLYEATYHEICPIKSDEGYKSTTNNCFFTDELMENVTPSFPHWYEVMEHNSPWFITMSKEDFVN